MLLTVDIGNTNTVIGIFKGERLWQHWRIGTVRERTSDEYGVVLSELFRGGNVDVSSLRGAIISCVVPSLNETFVEALSKYAGIRPLVVGPGIKTGISVLTDDPREVGADRVVNAVAAYNLYSGASIVVDFGTAVTFDFITSKGEYLGGAIAPGISISIDALFERAARLPRVEIVRPRRIIGRNTVESIQSGLFHGFASMVEGIVERMKKESPEPLKVIATGGMAHLFKDEITSIDVFDEFLTLKGLRIIYEVNRR